MPEIDKNEVLRDALSGLNEDVPPMPEGLHAAWMQKVEDDMNETRTEKTRTLKTVTRWLSVAAAMVFVVGGTLLTKDSLKPSALSYQSTYTDNSSMKRSLAENDMVYGAYTDETAEEESAMDTMATGAMFTMARSTENAAAPAAEASVPADKKIIRTASLTIVTQGYEAALTTLKSSCEGQGGWIESTNENMNSRTGLRTAYLTLRVPQDSLDAYLDGTDDLGRITSRSESAEDVTASYQDTQTRLNTQLALMERLQALITESADLSDLLALESQIADTQYQIDSLQSSLASTDRQVSYSTVTITLREEETVELTDTTVSLGERIVSAIQLGWEAFTGFLSDMVVFLVAALPFIAIVVIGFIIGKIIIRRRHKS